MKKKELTGNFKNSGTDYRLAIARERARPAIQLAVPGRRRERHVPHSRGVQQGR
jgi:hypothetical protein